MARHRLRLVASLIAFGGLALGCAIADQRKDIAATQGRIETKQATLSAEERQQAALAAQRDRLVADLNGREMTAAQLRARLESMRAEIESAPAATPADRKKRDDRVRRVNEMASRARAVEQDPGPSAQEKARREAALRESTRKALEVVLAN